MKAVESSLHQRSHDAAHVHFVATSVPLAIVLHPEPGETQTEEVCECNTDEPQGTDWKRVGGGDVRTRNKAARP